MTTKALREKTQDEIDLGNLTAQMGAVRELEMEAYAAIKALRRFVASLREMNSTDNQTIETCLTSISYLEEKAGSYQAWLVKKQDRMNHLIRRIVGD